MDPSQHDVAIFWDFENCRPATQSSGHDVADSIRRLAHTFGSVKAFKAYLDISECLPASSISTKSSVLRSQLQSSGVSLTDCPHNGQKDVADMMMMIDMMSYAMDTCPTSTTLIVITADRDFTYALSVLRLRRFPIVLITKDSAAMCLRSRGSVCYDWNTDILEKGPSIDTYRAGGVNVVGRPSNFSYPSASTPPNPSRDGFVPQTLTPHSLLEPTQAASKPPFTHRITVSSSDSSPNKKAGDYFSPASFLASSNSFKQPPSIPRKPPAVDMGWDARRASFSSPLGIPRGLQKIQDAPPYCKAETATLPQDCEPVADENMCPGTNDQNSAFEGDDRGLQLKEKQRAVEPEDALHLLSKDDESEPSSARQVVLATNVLCDAPPDEDADYTDSEADATTDTGRSPSLISADSSLDDCSESVIDDIPALGPARMPSISAGASSNLVGEGQIVTHPYAVPCNPSFDEDDKQKAHWAGVSDVAATFNHPPSHPTPVSSSHDCLESVADDISAFDAVRRPHMSIGASSCLGEGLIVTHPSAAPCNPSVDDDEPNTYSASGSDVAATLDHPPSRATPVLSSLEDCVAKTTTTAADIASTACDPMPVGLKPLPSGLLPIIEALERYASKGILEPYYLTLMKELLGIDNGVLHKAGVTTFPQYFALARSHKIVKISMGDAQYHQYLWSISLDDWKSSFIDPREKQQDLSRDIPTQPTTSSALLADSHIIPSTPLASSSITSPPTLKRKPLPAGLISLIDILERYLNNQNEAKPLCSKVALDIMSCGGPSIYAQANITRFREYRALAESAGIVQCGSKDGQSGTEWIMLLDWKKQYHDPRSPSVAHLKFEPLVQCLKRLSKRGIYRPLRSTVASELINHDNTVYKQAGVMRFAEYSQLAVEAKVAIMGGTKGEAWIAFNPEWYAKYSSSL